MSNLNNKYFNCDCRSRRSPFSRNCGVSSQLLLGERDPMSRVQTAHAQSTSCNLLARRDSGGAEGPAESRKVAACSRRSVAARFLSADWQFREAAGVELKGAGNGEAGPAQHACGEPSLSTRLCEFMTSWISPFVLLRRLFPPPVPAAAWLPPPFWGPRPLAQRAAPRPRGPACSGFQAALAAALAVCRHAAHAKWVAHPRGKSAASDRPPERWPLPPPPQWPGSGYSSFRKARCASLSIPT